MTLVPIWVLTALSVAGATLALLLLVLGILAGLRVRHWPTATVILTHLTIEERSVEDYSFGKGRILRKIPIGVSLHIKPSTTATSVKPALNPLGLLMPSLEFDRSQADALATLKVGDTINAYASPNDERDFVLFRRVPVSFWIVSVLLLAITSAFAVFGTQAAVAEAGFVRFLIAVILCVALVSLVAVVIGRRRRLSRQ